MRPRERRERLDQIINLNHALAKLAWTIDWRFLAERFGAVYTDGPGDTPLPTRSSSPISALWTLARRESRGIAWLCTSAMILWC
jgi:IS5 family transposase